MDSVEHINIVKDSEIIKKYVKENTFSIDWDFGCGSFNYDDIETYELDDIEEILDDKWQHNDDLLQIAILYKCNDTKLCHTMELCEIKWIEKDLLEKVKNNEKANYFERHCSCDFEFETTVINEKYIRLTITDKNEEPQIKFDEVILKNEFLSEMSRIFNEIERKTDELIDEYGKKNGLSSKEKEDLKTRLYEW